MTGPRREALKFPPPSRRQISVLAVVRNKEGAGRLGAGSLRFKLAFADEVRPVGQGFFRARTRYHALGREAWPRLFRHGTPCVSVRAKRCGMALPAASARTLRSEARARCL